jgi:hypothetical protein
MKTTVNFGEEGIPLEFHHCCPGVERGDRRKPHSLNEIYGVAALFDIFGEREFSARRQPRRHNAACSLVEPSSLS